jgi:hypothetical protein
MKKLMNIFFLSCVKATELIEKKLLFKLSPSEKIRLKMHKAMCYACAMYEKQSITLDKALSSPAKHEEKLEDLDNFRKSIIEKIEKRG